MSSKRYPTADTGHRPRAGPHEATRKGNRRDRTRSLDDNKRLVTRLFGEVFHEGTLDVLDDIMDERYRQHSPGVSQGRAGFKAFLSTMVDGFCGMRATIEHVRAEGDLVAAHSTWSGTHTGVFRGIPPMGREVSIASVDLYRVADGTLTWGCCGSAGWRPLRAMPHSRVPFRAPQGGAYWLRR